MNRIVKCIFAVGWCSIQFGDGNVRADYAWDQLPMINLEAGVDGNNVPIVYIPNESFDSFQMADEIKAAIDGSTLVGIDTRLDRDTVIIVNANNAGGSGIIFRDGIRDIAANNVKPNKDNGETSFRIIIEQGTDFGDAPAPYPTLRADSGAFHSIAGGLFLGSAVDQEDEGQPSDTVPGGDGADEDGVLVNRDGINTPLENIDLEVNQTETIIVRASAAGVVNAWFDFNNDGVWDDPANPNDNDEWVFRNEPVVAGSNTLEMPIAATIPVGMQTYARFRINSDGNLAPTGAAANGEVEDYQVTFGGNPWNNRDNPLDVNGSGTVTSVDTAIVVAELIERNFSQAGVPLPVPPVDPYIPTAGSPFAQFVDTNNDGFLDLEDVMAITEYLFGVLMAQQTPAPAPPVSDDDGAAPTGFAPPITGEFASSQPLQAPVYAAEAAVSSSADTPAASQDGARSDAFSLGADIVAIADTTAVPVAEIPTRSQDESEDIEAGEVTAQLDEESAELLTRDFVLTEEKPKEVDIDGLIDEISMEDEEDAASYDEIFTRLGR